MRPASALLALVLAGLAACENARPPMGLLESRVPLEPLLVKLKASGGDVGRIIQLRSLSDLVRLESKKRYKFVVLADGRMAIAPLPADAPSNEYAHPVLAQGAPVRTAGGLAAEHDGRTLRRVVVDQDSRAYCPPADSLVAALTELHRLGVPSDRFRLENRPPACVGAPPPEPPAPRYGAVMTEVGGRFERLGRAFKAQRLALATFELGEIEEVFTRDLPRAEPPEESAGVDLAGVAQAFRQTNIPELRKALLAKDKAAFREAYSRAAQTCNGCHRASGHPFVEIPVDPGQPVPRLDPVH